MSIWCQASDAGSCPLLAFPRASASPRLYSAFRLPPFVLLVLLSVSISVPLLAGCGKKTIVRPPELVAPEAINDLALEVKGQGVVLRWGRTQETVGGDDLADLGGFVILRAVQDDQGKGGDFIRLATLPVTDRERFRKNKKFSYTDEQLTVGTLYRYRVLAVTLDGYQGGASNTVELVWKGSDK